ncbi:MAG: hypothetical protein WKF84_24905 [Pyrinomonadaceae bacterium]
MMPTTTGHTAISCSINRRCELSSDWSPVRHDYNSTAGAMLRRATIIAVKAAIKKNPDEAVRRRWWTTP